MLSCSRVVQAFPPLYSYVSYVLLSAAHGGMPRIHVRSASGIGHYLSFSLVSLFCASSRCGRTPSSYRALQPIVDVNVTRPPEAALSQR